MTTKRLATHKQLEEVVELMVEGSFEEAAILFTQYTTIPEPLGFWDSVKRFIQPRGSGHGCY
jgi:hypothetical protein